NQDRHAIAFQKAIDRRQRRVTELFGLARRLEYAQKRRQQRDTGRKGDQHAEAGDQPELGHAFVNGGQKGQEAGGGRQRRQRQGRAGASAGLQQRFTQIVGHMALGAVAHAELDAEIDAEADEQDGKIDRYQIKRADEQHADRRRDRKTDGDADEYREDD